jgi:hypothetical protein
MAVPADLACVQRQQPEQRAQQRSLAAADSPGDHRERAALDPQVDTGDATAGIRMAVSQAGSFQHFERRS